MSRIIELVVENFMGIRAAALNPEGGVVVIGGKNAQGKTSLIRAIMAGVRGKRYAPNKPVHGDAKSAVIELKLGTDGKVEFDIKRTFSKDGKSTIKVKNGEGLSWSSPQQILDALAGAIAYDPLEFVRGDKKDQVAELVRLSGVDLTSIDENITALFDARAQTNRSVRDAEGRLAGMTSYEDAPSEAPDMDALLKEQADVRAHNGVGEELQGIADRTQSSYADNCEKGDLKLQQIQAAKLKVAAAESELEAFNDGLALMRLNVARCKEEAETYVYKDQSGVDAKIRDSSEVAAKVRANQARDAQRVDLGELRNMSESQTDELEQLREDRVEAIADSPLPVVGLSFSADGVTLDGIPIEQCSAAEQLKLSVSIGIAASPKLTVMLVRDGSLLDSDSLNVLNEIAEQHDHQIWIERVGDADAGAILIEDGLVVGAEQEAGDAEREEVGEAGTERSEGSGDVHGDANEGAA